MPSPPQTTTPLPYTTLFRSQRQVAGCGVVVAIIITEERPETECSVPRAIVKRDRKSTRLNSSHRCISYAVFCLKKKRRQESGRWLTLLHWTDVRGRSSVRGI